MAVEATSQHATATPAGFTAEVAAGEILHLWQRPVTAGATSAVTLREADGSARTLTGPVSDDFQMTTHPVATSGEIAIGWNTADTQVSVCYAFTPGTVAETGIRVLWTAPQAAAETTRYRLHLAPPFGWMNDPNGLITRDGRTEAFYQHYPSALRWDTMHWGHAVSDNLVDWTHLPVFLHPRPVLLADPALQGGAFSGSAIPGPDGSLRVFYTDREDDRLPAQEWQMTALSTDGLAAGPATAVIDERPPLEGFGNDLRDPYVFRGPDGLWKMVLGGNDATAALVLLYETPDPEAATGWRFVGVLHRETLPRSVPAECPCVLPLDGAGAGLHVVIFGLIGHHGPVLGRRNPSLALVGQFDGRTFREIARRELDFVGDCYAFQGFLHEGRPVGMAWGANWADVRRTKDFTSAMTFVRRLVWQDGVLYMPPAEAVEALRTAPLPATLPDGVALPDGLAEIAFETAGAPFRLDFAHAEHKLALVHDGTTLELVDDWPVRGRPVRNLAETGPLSEIRVFVDVGLIEIYADGGRWCGTRRLDSDTPVTAVRLEADAASITNAQVWQLRPQHGAPRPAGEPQPAAGRE